MEKALVETGWTVEQMADRLDYKSLKRAMAGEIPLPESKRRHIQDLVALAVAERKVPSYLLQDVEEEEILVHARSYGPREVLRKELQKSGLNPAQLAKRIGYKIGVIQALVEGNARISERMADAIVKVLPTLSKEDLMSGSESPMVLEEAGMRGTVGMKPTIKPPPGHTVRMIPLLSWAQAGAMKGFTDEAYDHEAVTAFDVSDPKAFAVTIRGDSMDPVIREGATVVVCPSWQPRNGEEVICRTVDGDVMCKIYQSKFNGQFVILSSYNSAHPPIELSRDEIAWIYPVHSYTHTRRTE